MRAKTFTDAEGAVYLLESTSLLKVGGRPTTREGIGGGKEWAKGMETVVG